MKSFILAVFCGIFFCSAIGCGPEKAEVVKEGEGVKRESTDGAAAGDVETLGE